MPPKVKTIVDYRHEFVLQALQDGANIRELCRRYHYAPATAYKWIARFEAGGLAALSDQSRCPHTSPTRTAAAVEAAVIAVRDHHPSWGGRTLHDFLVQQGLEGVPAPSTITNILRRQGRLPAAPVRPRAYTRFERDAPNDLWQLDFMGHRPLAQGRVHPLTLLDDHSRFGLALEACANERGATVTTVLTTCFRRYGLPWALLTDNGPPWGTLGHPGISRLEAWLIRLGIRVLHGRPAHPQTQGKIERWHGTVGREVFGAQPFADCAAAQVAFDQFRSCYNTERPHQALNGAVPASRYTPSPRSFPEVLPAIDYDPDDVIRIVRQKGEISVHGHRFYISEGLAGLPVALRPTVIDGHYAVRFCQHEVTVIDLRTR